MSIRSSLFGRAALPAAAGGRPFGAAPGPAPQTPAGPAKVLFFSHDAKLGDAVVNTAFVAGLHRSAPQCVIHATVAGATAGFWRRDSRVQTLWPVQKPTFGDIIRLGLALRREKYDYIVTWHKMRSEKNRLLLWLARPGAVIDLRDFNRGAVRHKIESCREALHQMHALGQAGPLGRSGRKARAAALQTGAARAAACSDVGCRDLAYDVGQAQRCSQLDSALPAGRELIVLNLFAGDAERNIGVADACRILRGLRGADPEALLCLVCTDATAPLAQQVLAQAGVGAQLVNCEQSLERLIDLCARASLIITPDTSLVHIASAFDTPVIGIYQNNGVKAVQWGPRSRLHGMVLSASADSIAGFSVDDLLGQAAALLRLARAGSTGI